MWALVEYDAHRRHRLDVNCLSDLPGSMVHLESLEELCLTSNFFAIFPEFAMKMSGLKKVLALHPLLHAGNIYFILYRGPYLHIYRYAYR